MVVITADAMLKCYFRMPDPQKEREIVLKFQITGKTLHTNNETWANASLWLQLFINTLFKFLQTISILV